MTQIPRTVVSGAPQKNRPKEVPADRMEVESSGTRIFKQPRNDAAPGVQVVEGLGNGVPTVTTVRDGVGVGTVANNEVAQLSAAMEKAVHAVPIAMIPHENPVHVVFDYGHGEQSATYSAIIKEAASLILVAREGAAITPFWPRASEAQFAVHVVGETVDSLVCTTGIKFKHAGHEYCVLMVLQEKPH